MATIRIYNAGDMIQDRLAFSLPDGADIHASGYVSIKLKPKDFSEVETEYRVGAAVVRLQIDQDILRKYGKRGVVLVDRNLDPKRIADGAPVAASDDAAERRGSQLWTEYLREIVRRHEEENAQSRSQGGAPRVPGGFTRRAYKLLGLEVPGDEIFRPTGAPAAAAAAGKVEELERQMQELQSQLAALSAKAPEPAAPGGKGRGSQPSLG